MLVCAWRIYLMKTQNIVRFRYEAVMAELAYCYFIYVSMDTMANLEKDPHLGYLTDKEEPEHRFFKVSVYQSVVVLILAEIVKFHAIAAEQSIICNKRRFPGRKTLDIVHIFFRDLLWAANRKVNKYFCKTHCK